MSLGPGDEKPSAGVTTAEAGDMIGANSEAPEITA